MEKEENFSAALPASFHGLDYSQQQQFIMKQQQIGETWGDMNSHQMVDYMLNNNNPQQQQQQQHISSGFCSSASLDHKLSFADVMQFADFGPKLALNQSKLVPHEEETGIDPVYFLKFPVLNDKLQQDDDDDDQSLLMDVPQPVGDCTHELEGLKGASVEERLMVEEEVQGRSVQLGIHGENLQKSPVISTEAKNKRKRPRSVKTSEEVESQRMTHIAVERNRRKQMNEHVRVLRSLMPGSYVQRGDQASIIGGAIEFVRELEQLLQCLESQKWRRLYGDSTCSVTAIHQRPQLMFPAAMPLPNDELQLVDLVEKGVLQEEEEEEETAEMKSSLADVEVKLLGFHAIIKILSRRRSGQLIRTISALEDLQLHILHLNITTIQQTVLYSFNVKVASEVRFTAEDIASSVQQIFSFIHANSSI